MKKVLLSILLMSSVAAVAGSEGVGGGNATNDKSGSAYKSDMFTISSGNQSWEPTDPNTLVLSIAGHPKGVVAEIIRYFEKAKIEISSENNWEVYRGPNNLKIVKQIPTFEVSLAPSEIIEISTAQKDFRFGNVTLIQFSGKAATFILGAMKSAGVKQDEKYPGKPFRGSLVDCYEEAAGPFGSPDNCKLTLVTDEKK